MGNGFEILKTRVAEQDSWDTRKSARPEPRIVSELEIGDDFEVAYDPSIHGTVSDLYFSSRGGMMVVYFSDGRRINLTSNTRVKLR